MSSTRRYYNVINQRVKCEQERFHYRKEGGKWTSWIQRERELMTCIDCDWEVVMNSEVIEESEGWSVVLVVPNEEDGDWVSVSISVFFYTFSLIRQKINWHLTNGKRKNNTGDWLSDTVIMILIVIMIVCVCVCMWTNERREGKENIIQVQMSHFVKEFSLHEVEWQLLSLD